MSETRDVSEMERKYLAAMEEMQQLAAQKFGLERDIENMKEERRSLCSELNEEKERFGKLDREYRAALEEMQQLAMQKFSLEGNIQSMKEEERFFRAELRAEKARFDKLLKSVAQTLAIVTRLDEE